MAAAVGISCVAYLVLTVKKIARDPAIPDQWLPRGKPQVLFEELIKFPEDLIIDHEKGLAIISADPGRHEWNTVMVSWDSFNFVLTQLEAEAHNGDPTGPDERP